MQGMQREADNFYISVILPELCASAFTKMAPEVFSATCSQTPKTKSDKVIGTKSKKRAPQAQKCVDPNKDTSKVPLSPQKVLISSSNSSTASVLKKHAFAKMTKGGML